MMTSLHKFLCDLIAFLVAIFFSINYFSQYFSFTCANFLLNSFRNVQNKNLLQLRLINLIFDALFCN